MGEMWNVATAHVCFYGNNLNIEAAVLYFIYFFF